MPSKTHLVSDRYPFILNNAVWTEETHWQYYKKRMQFWKWRLHHTMVRPVLVPRKSGDAG
jgi:hypothetical protein